MIGEICITDDLSNETATIEEAVARDDTPALAALVSHYRAEAAKWRADAEEKGRTLGVMLDLLIKNDLIERPS